MYVFVVVQRDELRAMQPLSQIVYIIVIRGNYVYMYAI